MRTDENDEKVIVCTKIFFYIFGHLKTETLTENSLM